jgi:hypothetical protein
MSSDPNRLQQVFWNLLHNAIKFTPKDGKVHVRLQSFDSHVEVSVIDTGEGIAADFFPYVFERFQQGDPSTTVDTADWELDWLLSSSWLNCMAATSGSKAAGSGKERRLLFICPSLLDVRATLPYTSSFERSRQTAVGKVPAQPASVAHRERAATDGTLCSRHRVVRQRPQGQCQSQLALSLISMLFALEKQLGIYRQRFEELFARHPDHDLFGSLPGAGPKLAPRLLSEIGDDRDRFSEGPQALQCLAGTAPVTRRTGKSKVQTKPERWPCHQRWACDKHLRHAIHLFAEQTLTRCVWAQIYYNSHRQKGTPMLCVAWASVG